MPSIAVVGSVNLDIVATVARLPKPGETVTGAELSRYPGGKGANQALAAKRLGADVSLYARVGRDAAADEALALLRAGGVDLAHCTAVGWSKPKLDVFANTTAATYPSTAKAGRRQLADQLGSPVRFREMVDAMYDAGVTHFVEVGPGRVLRGLMKRIHRKVPCEGVSV